MGLGGESYLAAAETNSSAVRAWFAAVCCTVQVMSIGTTTLLCGRRVDHQPSLIKNKHITQSLQGPCGWWTVFLRVGARSLRLRHAIDARMPRPTEKDISPLTAVTDDGEERDGRAAARRVGHDAAAPRRNKK